MYKIIKNIASFIIFNSTALYGRFNYNYYNRNSKNALKKSEKSLLKFIEKNKNTEFGKKYNFKNIKTIKDYQNNVPYTTYKDYLEMIKRTLNNGEQNLMVKDKICYFASTSGTTGKVKMIPVVKHTVKPFIKGGSILTWNLKTILKQKKKGLLYGNIFNLSEMRSKGTPSGIRVGLISGYFTYNLKNILQLTTCIPKEVLKSNEQMDMMYIKARYAIQEKNIIGINAVFMSAIIDLINYIYVNHDMLIKDIEDGKINNLINIPPEIKNKLEKNLKPDKKRADELKEVFKDITSEEELFVPKIWERLCLINGICTGEFSPYERKIRKYCGNNVAISYSMYAASEATMACALLPENKEYMLLSDSGFYEFIPTEDEEKTLLMNQLEIGKTYEIVITNYSGLYRYRIKDVIRVIGFKGEVPLIEVAYRKDRIAKVYGINLNIESLDYIIKMVENEINVNILDYSIYVDRENIPERLIVFLEAEERIPKEIDLGAIFDKKIEEYNELLNETYMNIEKGKTVVHLVKTGTYKDYRESKIKKGAIVNQIKTVRLIDDSETLDYFLKCEE